MCVNINLCLLIDYPLGWVYLKPAQKYYRVIFELMDWNKADMRCRALGAYSRLADINDDMENKAVKKFISSFDGTCSIILFAELIRMERSIKFNDWLYT